MNWDKIDNLIGTEERSRGLDRNDIYSLHPPHFFLETCFLKRLIMSLLSKDEICNHHKSLFSSISQRNSCIFFKNLLDCEARIVNVTSDFKRLQRVATFKFFSVFSNPIFCFCDFVQILDINLKVFDKSCKLVIIWDYLRPKWVWNGNGWRNLCQLISKQRSKVFFQTKSKSWSQNATFYPIVGHGNNTSSTFGGLVATKKMWKRQPYNSNQKMRKRQPHSGNQKGQERRKKRNGKRKKKPSAVDQYDGHQNQARATPTSKKKKQKKKDVSGVRFFSVFNP